MRTTRGWTGPRMAAVALTLGLLGLATPGARGSVLVSYNTSGTIGSDGITGTPNTISFNSVANGVFLSPSQFSMGDFLVAPLGDGQKATYKDTPFSISIFVKDVDGKTPTSSDPIVVTGVLNGDVVGPNQSSVKATFNKLDIKNPVFITGDLTNTLSLPPGETWLVPSTNHGGLTSAQGQMETVYTATNTPAPEPATLTIFAVAIAGYGLRRRLQRSRRPA